MAAKPISLALQGGGAHGAFTWGVLDAIAEDGSLDPTAITATSAGAMNACAFAMGRVRGGNDGARQALEDFWKAVSTAGTPFRAASAPGWSTFVDALNLAFSPYDVNPLNFDPLGDILDEQIDFEAVQACQSIQLFITATDVETGRARVFKDKDVTLEAVRASATLPFIHQAVEIDGVPYWDGGFTGNPALWPLFYADTPRDLVIVHINPMHRAGTPKTAEDILNRANEITFNASLIAELRAIAFVKRLIGDGMVNPQKAHLRDILMHSIRADTALEAYSASTKYDTRWSFLTELRDQGREAAFEWLARCAKHVGERSTIDLKAEFLDG